MNNKDNLPNQIEFIESHIGGKQDDSVENFKNQKELIEDGTTVYARLIDYYNKLNRTKNESDAYIQRLDVLLNTNPYRLNTLPTQIDGINYTNPIVFPQEYDEYFEYLAKKKLWGLNTKVLIKKLFVNIDSANRNAKTTLTLDNYLKLQDNSLVFTPNSKKIKILLNDANQKYIEGQKITLRGFGFYKKFYQSLNLYFKDGSELVILDIKPNFLNTIPYYDILINITGVTNGISTTYKNIPLSVINQPQTIEIVDINSDLRLGFRLPLKFYTDNDLSQTLISDCEITFYNLGNYPISLINANAPITEYNLTPYHIITSVAQDYIEINLINEISLTNSIDLMPGYWLNNNFYTGVNIEISTIIGVDIGYPTPNSFTINLDTTLNNVGAIKVLSSEIPNVQKNIVSSLDNLRTTANSSNFTISKSNSKLYWNNLLDLPTYSINIPTGYYTFSQLQSVITDLVNKTPRTSTQPNLTLYNNMEVILDESSNISTFKSYSLYNLPKCLQSYNEIPDPVNIYSNKYVIKINHPNHNLKLGDTIFITSSLDYFIISQKYINIETGHVITNIINNNYYEITLKNINPIPDSGDTGGGYSIQIKTPNSFRLRFDFSDTFGSQIGFRYVGNSLAITKYSSENPENKVTNLQPYTYDIGKILITNNTVTPEQLIFDFNKNTFDYVLLQCTNFNTVSNPNGPPFFCKFLLTNSPGTIATNTFVQTPTYLNPPIRTLSNLEFKFIYPNGTPVNFYNKNYSLTIEIDSFNNTPENTGINTFTARL